MERPEVAREQVYNHVWSLLDQFSEYFPEHGRQIANVLAEVHAIPEIGYVIYEEERSDILAIIETLRSELKLDNKEQLILQEALNLLTEIEEKLNVSKH